MSGGDGSAGWLLRGGSELLDTARRRAASVKDLLDGTASTLRDKIPQVWPLQQDAGAVKVVLSSTVHSSDVVLRESEALLALLQDATSEMDGASGCSSVASCGTSSSSARGAADVSPLSSMASSSPDAMAAQLQAAAASDDGGKQLRDELARFVSNAQLPLGAALCQHVSDFRQCHAVGGPAAIASSEVLTPGTAAMQKSLQELPQLPQRLWQKLSQGGRPDANAPPAGSAAALLAAAVESVHVSRAALVEALNEQLPVDLRAEARVMREALHQLDAALHRALFPAITPLYLQAFGDDIARLAQICHELRMLLPCDMQQLPSDLWLLPTSAAAQAAADASEGESGELDELRWCGAADPRLPYASAIQLLRTISFYRTPSDKAKVMLEACEEVVKCATRALSLRSAGLGGHAHGRPSKLGADDLLPLVVYVLVRSGIYNIPAELQYVSDFLHDALHYGKEGYALVSMQCACRVAADLAWGTGLLRDRPQAPEQRPGEI